LPEFLSTVGSGIRVLLKPSDAEPRARLRPSSCDGRRTHSRFRSSQPIVKRFHGRSRAGRSPIGRLRPMSAM
jgi:hypothetical protein